ncbi:MAG TPA: choice-of-anchor D domain-containing protein, partial [Myxococcaceae bacterium]|nr:choice-of-anchor D domain-containing protein [Myxococcaceae bacterium]
MPKTLSVQVQNSGTATLTVTSSALCSGTTNRFSVSPSSLTVAAGQSGTINVTYTPTGAATDSGCVALVHDAPNQTRPLKINLSATGSSAPAPSIAVNPTSLSFGTVTVGMPKTLSVQVQNTGTATLSVTSVTLCSGTTTRFSVSPGSVTVAAGQSGTVNVTYTPTGATTDSGCIALTHDAPNQTSPLNVNLTATGSLAPAASMDVSPTSLSFGTVMVGSPTTLDLHVQNNGTASLNVSSVALCSGTTTRFSVSPASLTIAAGQSVTVHVTYTPTSATADSGCIALTHNATNQASPLNVNVSGTGSSVATPSIALNPSGLSFGAVKTGTPKTMTVQVENNGAAALTVSSVALCSGTPAVVTWNPGAPLTVSAGGTASLDVTYAPTDTAPLPTEACLMLTSNDPSNPSLMLPIAGSTSSGPPADIIGGCSSLPSGGSGAGILLGLLLATGTFWSRRRQTRAGRGEPRA